MGTARRRRLTERLPVNQDEDRSQNYSYSSDLGHRQVHHGLPPGGGGSPLQVDAHFGSSVISNSARFRQSPLSQPQHLQGQNPVFRGESHTRASGGGGPEGGESGVKSTAFIVSWSGHFLL